MGPRVDPRHLAGLLGSAGKSVAHMPEARRVVRTLRDARTQEDLLFFLRSVDLGMAEPAQRTIVEAASDPDGWSHVHAALLRSAEQQLQDRFDPSS